MIRKVAPFLIFAAAFVVYLPAIHGGFIWDDDAHVTKAALRSLHGLREIWFDVGATQQYYPVLHSAFWIEHRLWGDGTLGYHLVNILLHAASACLFGLILERLWAADPDIGPAVGPTGGRASGCASIPYRMPDHRSGLQLSLDPAWFAALLFAVHPVCVESVAWISEQKNTLSTFFYLLSALVYLRSRRPRAGIAPAGNTPGADVPRGTAGDAALPLAKGPSPGAYALSTLLFALALMSKSVTASLPAALLVVVWWKNGRLSWRRDVLPLVPWFAMAVGFGLVTAWFERRMMEIEHVTVALTLGQRLLLAGRVLGFYLGKLFWPTDLIFMYPKWNVSVAVWWQYLFPAGVAALLVLLWLRPFATLGKWGRGPLAGFLFFAGTLFPALGFLNAFPFRYTYVADHFQYLASLGVFAAAAGGWGEWVRGRPVRLAAGVPLAVLCVLGVLSFRQAGTYRDLETVYRTTIDRNPGCWMVRTNLGALLLEKGNPKEAEAQLRESLKDNPGLAETHYDLANALLAEGRLGDAIPEYEKAHDLNPNVVEIEMNLGNALYKAGRVIEASAHFSRALQLQPEGNYLALHNLAATLCAIGRYPQAIERYRAALLLAPSLPDAHYSLGLALDQAGGFDEAVSEFQKALQLGPDDPEVRTNLGIALANAGRLADSIPQFEAAVRLAPGNAGYHYNLGTALRAAGRVLEATEQLTRAAQLDPKAYGGRR